MIKYEYEINFSLSWLEKNIEESNYYDEWGMAFMWLNENNGIELNVCYDRTTDELVNCSAFYPFSNEWLDMKNEYRHCEIDFSDDEWRDRLAESMEECVDELVENGYWEV